MRWPQNRLIPVAVSPLPARPWRPAWTTVTSSSAKVPAVPADIGYRAAISAYSRDVLAATLSTHIDDLPDFPFAPADSLIVVRTNPVDAQGVGDR